MGNNSEGAGAISAQCIDLTGEWQVRGTTREPEWFAATVPGCIHLDLLAAQKIPDPFWRDNEKLVQWISEDEWTYAREFDVPRELLEEEVVTLRCDGLDTLATIRLNGRLVGEANNMYRTWQFNVKRLLRVGQNRIEITFASALLHTRTRMQDRPIHAWLSREEGVNYIRKEPCNYGWDWGPKLITCGIWRGISLSGWSTSRVGDVLVTQEHRAKRVDVSVRVRLQRPPVRKSKKQRQVAVTVSLYFANQLVGEECYECAPDAEQKIMFPVRNPKLWYPRGLGEQPLYILRVEVQDHDGQLLDAWQKRIGLRDLRLERKRDKWGESFRFTINGAPFFAKGANWIPADAFAPRVTHERYRHLLQSAANANMNMLRVWGGGVYEDEAFYDLCDELGLCVWQDFMFACACYPTFDRAYLKNVELEAEEVVRRLRHHSCIALWCGNNELEQGLCGPKWTVHQMPWEQYGKIFDRILPAVITREDPQRDYWPGSPHTPCGDRVDCNNPDSGDAHLWKVWHGGEPFEWYRTSQHRFCSEFGFQSFPEPKTIRAFSTQPDWNISSFVMDHHQRSWVGNSAILTYLLRWYRMPRDFWSLVWMSQLVQATAMKYAVEHWRRNMPRSMGALYWQLNDTWPGPSWSSIDYFGRWKALHYLARRFFAPLMLSMVEDLYARRVEIWISNDKRTPVAGKLRLLVTNCAGALLHEENHMVRIARLKSAMVMRFDVSTFAREEEWPAKPKMPALTAGGVPVDSNVGPRNLVVWAELRVEGELVSSNSATFAKPKHLLLQDPELKWKVRKTRSGFTVALKASRFALGVWLELDDLDAQWSDNFFDLPPGVTKQVEVTLPGNLSKAEFNKRLVVHSVFDAG